ncbi:hypothetical protein BHMPCIPO_04903 [Ensifer sesbaniae]|nr:hypothetical protein [Ensifer sesbaniae]
MARESSSDCLSDEVSETRVHTSPNRLALIRLFKIEARSLDATREVRKGYFIIA